MEKVEDPCVYQHIARTYNISNYSSAVSLSENLAEKCGKLLQGGEPDMNTLANMVLNDFLRGKLPWFTEPPKDHGESALAVVQPQIE